MTEYESKKCHAIIHSTSALAGGVGAGLAQIPASDNALLIPLQIGMIISLGSVFSMELTESAARATLAKLLFSRPFCDQLYTPEKLTFGSLKEDGILFVGESVPNTTHTYEFYDNVKSIIHNHGLVMQLIEDFNLDFKNTKYIKFTDIEFDEYDGKPIAIINMNS